jgi:hypothetical protein
MLWFEQGLFRWRWLSTLGDEVSLARIFSGPIIRSRHTEQPVSPRVCYRMTCLLIRNIVGSVPCSVVREWYRDYLRATRCKRGHRTVYYPGNISITRVLQLPKQSRTYDP